ncbi:hypothetical protein MMC31_005763 [Peltigera leucophlebia]|nr:hypothetical protein [Peltigera leucophlebia]
MRSTTSQYSTHDQQPQALRSPMQADGLALISEPDFAKACRSLVKRSRDMDLLGMSLRQCPETGTEYLASVRTQIPSHVIPSLSDYEAEANEGSAEEDELDQQSTMQTPQNL